MFSEPIIPIEPRGPASTSFITGDFGPFQPLSPWGIWGPAGMSLQCDFGICGSVGPNAFVGEDVLLLGGAIAAPEIAVPILVGSLAWRRTSDTGCTNRAGRKTSAKTAKPPRLFVE